MEELFRFSVIRAVTKSQPNLLPLANSPIPATTGRISVGSKFQASLQAQVQQLIAAGETPQSLWQRIEPIAVQYVVANAAAVLNSNLWNDLASLLDDLNGLATQTPSPTINLAAIKAVFAQYPSLTGLAVTGYQPGLADLFLALLVVRRGGPSALDGILRAQNLGATAVLLGSSPTLPEISRRLAACAIIIAGAANLVPPTGTSAADAQAAIAASLAAAVNATVVVPPGILNSLPKPILGIGFRELHVVKQNIRRYQTAEIGRIENILKGESRDHIQRHTLSTETDTTESESTTTMTDKELTTDDHTDIKNETQDQVNTATKLGAGVHAQYSGPSFKLQADLNVSYDHSDQTTKQYSADTAKDVTQKAVSTVTEVVTRTQTTKIIEAFFDKERQSFNNTTGAGNISGIYQWIEKVYLSQVFNLGRHMVVDITVPEPGANLLAMATATPNQDPPPIQPHPLGTILSDANGNPILDNYGRLQVGKPLNPLDISQFAYLDHAAAVPVVPDPNYYGTWISYYGATSVAPPPSVQKTFSASLVVDYQDDSNKSKTGDIAVDDGYAGIKVNVSISANANDEQTDASKVFIMLTVGGAVLQVAWPPAKDSDGYLIRSYNFIRSALIDPPATGDVSVLLYGNNIDQMAASVELICAPQPVLIDQWKLQTYEKIVDAYNNLQQTYTAAIAARKLESQTVGPLGSSDEDANRLTELIELKRSCIAIFDNNNATVAGTNVIQLNPPQALNPSDPTKPQLPEPVLDTSQSLGARVRWFEQAFEWENIAYVFYPYYWGRRTRWVPGLTLTNEDPIFLSFLQAGYARVVVPVRLGFETAVQFYLNSGLPWLGGDLPSVGDDTQNPLYLDVAEEIKNLTGGGYSGEIEVPVGDPWEYVLPTTLIKLRDDDTLPEWHRVPPSPANANDPAYASDAPDGAWTWLDGPPGTASTQPVPAQANKSKTKTKTKTKSKAGSP
jgi:hypothetical protein